jgi:hypothetical protein
MDIEGTLVSEEARECALRCCFANYRLHSPRVFEYLQAKNQENQGGLLGMGRVAAILSINTGKGYEITPYERHILWNAFHTHGWRIFTFIGNYSTAPLRALDRHEKFHYDAAMGQGKLAKFFHPVSHLLNRNFALKKLITFTSANFLSLYALTEGQKMEDACREYVKGKGNERYEKAYLARSKKWSPKKHFQFLENLFNNPAAANKELGLTGRFANILPSFLNRI